MDFETGSDTYVDTSPTTEPSDEEQLVDDHIDPMSDDFPISHNSSSDFESEDDETDEVDDAGEEDDISSADSDQLYFRRSESSASVHDANQQPSVAAEESPVGDATYDSDSSDDGPARALRDLLLTAPMSNTASPIGSSQEVAAASLGRAQAAGAPAAAAAAAAVGSLGATAPGGVGPTSLTLAQREDFVVYTHPVSAAGARGGDAATSGVAALRAAVANDGESHEDDEDGEAGGITDYMSDLVVPTGPRGVARGATRKGLMTSTATSIPSNGSQREAPHRHPHHQNDDEEAVQHAWPLLPSAVKRLPYPPYHALPNPPALCSLRAPRDEIAQFLRTIAIEVERRYREPTLLALRSIVAEHRAESFADEVHSAADPGAATSTGISLLKATNRARGAPQGNSPMREEPVSQLDWLLALVLPCDDDDRRSPVEAMQPNAEVMRNIAFLLDRHMEEFAQAAQRLCEGHDPSEGGKQLDVSAVLGDRAMRRLYKFCVQMLADARQESQSPSYSMCFKIACALVVLSRSLDLAIDFASCLLNLSSHNEPSVLDKEPVLRNRLTRLLAFMGGSQPPLTLQRARHLDGVVVQRERNRHRLHVHDVVVAQLPPAVLVCRVGNDSAADSKGVAPSRRPDDFVVIELRASGEHRGWKVSEHQSHADSTIIQAALARSQHGDEEEKSLVGSTRSFHYSPQPELAPTFMGPCAMHTVYMSSSHIRPSFVQDDNAPMQGPTSGASPTAQAAASISGGRARFSGVAVSFWVRLLPQHMSQHRPLDASIVEFDVPVEGSVEPGHRVDCPLHVALHWRGFQSSSFVKVTFSLGRIQASASVPVEMLTDQWSLFSAAVRPSTRQCHWSVHLNGEPVAQLSTTPARFTPTVASSQARFSLLKGSSFFGQVAGVMLFNSWVPPSALDDAACGRRVAVAEYEKSLLIRLHCCEGTGDVLVNDCPHGATTGIAYFAAAPFSMKWQRCATLPTVRVRASISTLRLSLPCSEVCRAGALWCMEHATGNVMLLSEGATFTSDKAGQIIAAAGRGGLLPDYVAVLPPPSSIAATILHGGLLYIMEEGSDEVLGFATNQPHLDVHHHGTTTPVLGEVDEEQYVAIEASKLVLAMQKHPFDHAAFRHAQLATVLIASSVSSIAASHSAKGAERAVPVMWKETFGGGDDGASQLAWLLNVFNTIRSATSAKADSADQDLRQACLAWLLGRKLQALSAVDARANRDDLERLVPHLDSFSVLGEMVASRLSSEEQRFGALITATSWAEKRALLSPARLAANLMQRLQVAASGSSDHQDVARFVTTVGKMIHEFVASSPAADAIGGLPVETFSALIVEVCDRLVIAASVADDEEWRVHCVELVVKLMTHLFESATIAAAKVADKGQGSRSSTLLKYIATPVLELLHGNRRWWNKLCPQRRLDVAAALEAARKNYHALLRRIDATEALRGTADSEVETVVYERCDVVLSNEAAALGGKKMNAVVRWPHVDSVDIFAHLSASGGGSNKSSVKLGVSVMDNFVVKSHTMAKLAGTHPRKLSLDHGGVVTVTLDPGSLAKASIMCCIVGKKKVQIRASHPLARVDEYLALTAAALASAALITTAIGGSHPTAAPKSASSSSSATMQPRSELQDSGEFVISYTSLLRGGPMHTGTSCTSVDRGESITGKLIHELPVSDRDDLLRLARGERGSLYPSPWNEIYDLHVRHPMLLESRKRELEPLFRAMAACISWHVPPAAPDDPLEGHLIDVCELLCGKLLLLLEILQSTHREELSSVSEESTPPKMDSPAEDLARVRESPDAAASRRGTESPSRRSVTGRSEADVVIGRCLWMLSEVAPRARLEQLISAASPTTAESTGMLRAATSHPCLARFATMSPTTPLSAGGSMSFGLERMVSTSSDALAGSERVHRHQHHAHQRSVTAMLRLQANLLKRRGTGAGTGGGDHFTLTERLAAFLIHGDDRIPGDDVVVMREELNRRAALAALQSRAIAQINSLVAAGAEVRAPFATTLLVELLTLLDHSATLCEGTEMHFLQGILGCGFDLEARVQKQWCRLIGSLIDLKRVVEERPDLQLGLCALLCHPWEPADVATLSFTRVFGFLRAIIENAIHDKGILEAAGAKGSENRNKDSAGPSAGTQPGLLDMSNTIVLRKNKVSSSGHNGILVVEGNGGFAAQIMEAKVYLNAAQPFTLKSVSGQANISYFEVVMEHIDATGEEPLDGAVVGLLERHEVASGASTIPSEVLGYCNDGSVCCAGSSSPMGPRVRSGDVVGCGLMQPSGEVFFTINGEFLGIAGSISKPLAWPFFGLKAKSISRLFVNFGCDGAPFAFDVGRLYLSCRSRDITPRMLLHAGLLTTIHLVASVTHQQPDSVISDGDQQSAAAARERINSSEQLSDTTSSTTAAAAAAAVDSGVVSAELQHFLELAAGWVLETGRKLVAATMRSGQEPKGLLLGNANQVAMMVEVVTSLNFVVQMITHQRNLSVVTTRTIHDLGEFMIKCITCVQLPGDVLHQVLRTLLRLARTIPNPEHLFPNTCAAESSLLDQLLLIACGRASQLPSSHLESGNELSVTWAGGQKVVHGRGTFLSDNPLPQRGTYRIGLKTHRDSSGSVGSSLGSYYYIGVSDGPQSFSSHEAIRDTTSCYTVHDNTSEQPRHGRLLCPMSSVREGRTFGANETLNIIVDTEAKVVTFSVNGNVLPLRFENVATSNLYLIAFLYNENAHSEIVEVEMLSAATTAVTAVSNLNRSAALELLQQLHALPKFCVPITTFICQSLDQFHTDLNDALTALGILGCERSESEFCIPSRGNVEVVSTHGAHALVFAIDDPDHTRFTVPVSSLGPIPVSLPLFSLGASHIATGIQCVRAIVRALRRILAPEEVTVHLERSEITARAALLENYVADVRALELDIIGMRNIVSPAAFPAACHDPLAPLATFDLGACALPANYIPHGTPSFAANVGLKDEAKQMMLMATFLADASKSQTLMFRCGALPEREEKMVVDVEFHSQHTLAGGGDPQRTVSVTFDRAAVNQSLTGAPISLSWHSNELKIVGNSCEARPIEIAPFVRFVVHLPSSACVILFDAANPQARYPPRQWVNSDPPPHHRRSLSMQCSACSCQCSPVGPAPMFYTLSPESAAAADAVGSGLFPAEAASSETQLSLCKECFDSWCFPGAVFYRLDALREQSSLAISSQPPTRLRPGQLVEVASPSNLVCEPTMPSSICISALPHLVVTRGATSVIALNAFPHFGRHQLSFRMSHVSAPTGKSFADALRQVTAIPWLSTKTGTIVAQHKRMYVSERPLSTTEPTVFSIYTEDAEEHSTGICGLAPLDELIDDTVQSDAWYAAEESKKLWGTTAKPNALYIFAYFPAEQVLHVQKQWGTLAIREGKVINVPHRGNLRIFFGGFTGDAVTVHMGESVPPHQGPAFHIAVAPDDPQVASPDVCTFTRKNSVCLREDGSIQVAGETAQVSMGRIAVGEAIRVEVDQASKVVAFHRQGALAGKVPLPAHLRSTRLRAYCFSHIPGLMLASISDPFAIMGVARVEEVAVDSSVRVEFLDERWRGAAWFSAGALRAVNVNIAEASAIRRDSPLVVWHDDALQRGIVAQVDEATKLVSLIGKKSKITVPLNDCYNNDDRSSHFHPLPDLMSAVADVSHTFHVGRSRFRQSLTNSYNGIMFDVVPKKHVIITHLQVISDTTGSNVVSVFTKDSSMLANATDRAAWTCVFEGTIAMIDGSMYEIKLSDTIVIRSNQTQAIYVNATSNCAVKYYSEPEGCSGPVGGEIDNDGTLSVRMGRRSDSRTPFNDVPSSARGFAGVISYKVVAQVQRTHVPPLDIPLPPATQFVRRATVAVHSAPPLSELACSCVITFTVRSGVSLREIRVASAAKEGTRTFLHGTLDGQIACYWPTLTRDGMLRLFLVDQLLSTGEHTLTLRTTDGSKVLFASAAADNWQTADSDSGKHVTGVRGLVGAMMFATRLNEEEELEEADSYTADGKPMSLKLTPPTQPHRCESNHSVMFEVRARKALLITDLELVTGTNNSSLRVKVLSRDGIMTEKLHNLERWTRHGDFTIPVRNGEPFSIKNVQIPISAGKHRLIHVVTSSSSGISVFDLQRNSKNPCLTNNFVTISQCVLGGSETPLSGIQYGRLRKFAGAITIVPAKRASSHAAAASLGWGADEVPTTIPHAFLFTRISRALQRIAHSASTDLKRATEFRCSVLRCVTTIASVGNGTGALLAAAGDPPANIEALIRHVVEKACVDGGGSTADSGAEGAPGFSAAAAISASEAAPIVPLFAKPLRYEGLSPLNVGDLVTMQNGNTGIVKRFLPPSDSTEAEKVVVRFASEASGTVERQVPSSSVIPLLYVSDIPGALTHCVVKRIIANALGASAAADATVAQMLDELAKGKPAESEDSKSKVVGEEPQVLEGSHTAARTAEAGLGSAGPASASSFHVEVDPAHDDFQMSVTVSAVGSHLRDVFSDVVASSDAGQENFQLTVADAFTFQKAQWSLRFDRAHQSRSIDISLANDGAIRGHPTRMFSSSAVVLGRDQRPLGEACTATVVCFSGQPTFTRVLSVNVFTLAAAVDATLDLVKLHIKLQEVPSIGVPLLSDPDLFGVVQRFRSIVDRGAEKSELGSPTLEGGSVRGAKATPASPTGSPHAVIAAALGASALASAHYAFEWRCEEECMACVVCRQGHTDDVEPERIEKQVRLVCPVGHALCEVDPQSRGNLSCAHCRAGSSAGSMVHTCDACNYTLCGSCAEYRRRGLAAATAAARRLCPSNHVLSSCEVAVPFKCSCSSPQLVNQQRQTVQVEYCAQCNFGICPECANPSEPLMQLRDNERHLLERQDIEHDHWVCCSNLGNCDDYRVGNTHPHLACVRDGCSFVICEYCAAMQMGIPPHDGDLFPMRLNHGEHITCSECSTDMSNGTVCLGNLDYSGTNRFICSNCASEHPLLCRQCNKFMICCPVGATDPTTCSRCHVGRWAAGAFRYTCDGCNSWVCLRCCGREAERAAPQHARCRRGHQMFLQRATSDFTCDSCMRHFSKDRDKRFRCEECDYDWCEDCFAHHGARTTVRCPGGHHLHNISCDDRRLLCDNCGSAIGAHDRTHRCETCDFDLCVTCHRERQEKLTSEELAAISKHLTAPLEVGERPLFITTTHMPEAGGGSARQRPAATVRLAPQNSPVEVVVQCKKTRTVLSSVKLPGASHIVLITHIPGKVVVIADGNRVLDVPRPYDIQGLPADSAAVRVALRTRETSDRGPPLVAHKEDFFEIARTGNWSQHLPEILGLEHFVRKPYHELLAAWPLLREVHESLPQLSFLQEAWQHPAHRFAAVFACQSVFEKIINEHLSVEAAAQLVTRAIEGQPKGEGQLIHFHSGAGMPPLWVMIPPEYFIVGRREDRSRGVCGDATDMVLLASIVNGHITPMTLRNIQCGDRNWNTHELSAVLEHQNVAQVWTTLRNSRESEGIHTVVFVGFTFPLDLDDLKTPTERVVAAAQLLVAVEHIHLHGVHVVHRHIRPENLLLEVITSNLQLWNAYQNLHEDPVAIDALAACSSAARQSTDIHCALATALYVATGTRFSDITSPEACEALRSVVQRSGLSTCNLDTLFKGLGPRIGDPALSMFSILEDLSISVPQFDVRSAQVTRFKTGQGLSNGSASYYGIMWSITAQLVPIIVSSISFVPDTTRDLRVQVFLLPRLCVGHERVGDGWKCVYEAKRRVRDGNFEELVFDSPIQINSGNTFSFYVHTDSSSGVRYFTDLPLDSGSAWEENEFIQLHVGYSGTESQPFRDMRPSRYFRGLVTYKPIPFAQCRSRLLHSGVATSASSSTALSTEAPSLIPGAVVSTTIGEHTFVGVLLWKGHENGVVLEVEADMRHYVPLANIQLADKITTVNVLSSGIGSPMRITSPLGASRSFMMHFDANSLAVHNINFGECHGDGQVISIRPAATELLAIRGGGGVGGDVKSRERGTRSSTGGQLQQQEHHEPLIRVELLDSPDSTVVQKVFVGSQVAIHFGEAMHITMKRGNCAFPRDDAPYPDSVTDRWRVPVDDASAVVYFRIRLQIVSDAPAASGVCSSVTVFMLERVPPPVFTTLKPGGLSTLTTTGLTLTLQGVADDPGTQTISVKTHWPWARSGGHITLMSPSTCEDDARLVLPSPSEDEAMERVPTATFLRADGTFLFDLAHATTKRVAATTQINAAVTRVSQPDAAPYTSPSLVLTSPTATCAYNVGQPLTSHTTHDIMLEIAVLPPDGRDLPLTVLVGEDSLHLPSFERKHGSRHLSAVGATTAMIVRLHLHVDVDTDFVEVLNLETGLSECTRVPTCGEQLRIVFTKPGAPVVRVISWYSWPQPPTRKPQGNVTDGSGSVVSRGNENPCSSWPAGARLWELLATQCKINASPHQLLLPSSSLRCASKYVTKESRAITSLNSKAVQQFVVFEVRQMLLAFVTDIQTSPLFHCRFDLSTGTTVIAPPSSMKEEEPSELINPHSVFRLIAQLPPQMLHTALIPAVGKSLSPALSVFVTAALTELQHINSHTSPHAVERVIFSVVVLSHARQHVDRKRHRGLIQTVVVALARLICIFTRSVRHRLCEALAAWLELLHESRSCPRAAVVYLCPFAKMLNCAVKDSGKRNSALVVTGLELLLATLASLPESEEDMSMLLGHTTQSAVLRGVIDSALVLIKCVDGLYRKEYLPCALDVFVLKGGAQSTASELLQRFREDVEPATKSKAAAKILTEKYPLLAEPQSIRFYRELSAALGHVDMKMVSRKLQAFSVAVAGAATAGSGGDAPAELEGAASAVTPVPPAITVPTTAMAAYPLLRSVVPTDMDSDVTNIGVLWQYIFHVLFIDNIFAHFHKGLHFKGRDSMLLKNWRRLKTVALVNTREKISNAALADVQRSLSPSSGGSVRKIKVHIADAQGKLKRNAEATLSSSIFGQVFAQLRLLGGSDFARNQLFSVEMIGLAAQDAGGPYRECMTALGEELWQKHPSGDFNVNPLFTTYTDDPLTLMPISNSALAKAHQAEFEFFGQLLAHFVLTDDVLVADLSPLFWKALLDDQIEVTDLPSEYQNIADDPFMDLETADSLAPGLRELWRDGPREPSAAEMGQLLCEYEVASRSIAMSRIRHGFSRVIPPDVMQLLLWSDVAERACGKGDITVEALMNVVDVELSSTEQRQWFTGIVADMTGEDRQCLLRFATGQRRLPLPPGKRIKVRGSDRSDHRLPTSATCFYSMKVPNYSSRDVMQRRLLFAIRNCTVIDGDGGVQGEMLIGE